MKNSFQESVKTSQVSSNLKLIVAKTSMLTACTVFVVGIVLYISPFTYTFYYTGQRELRDKLTNHLKAATSSTTVVLAKQQVAEAIEEIDQYIKLHPLAENSGNEFKEWYTNLVAIKGQLDLAEQVENSNATGLEKLQAESIATVRLEKFAETATGYNVPDLIPIRLNPTLEAIDRTSWLMFPLGIVSIFLMAFGLQIISDVEEL